MEKVLAQSQLIFYEHRDWISGSEMRETPSGLLTVRPADPSHHITKNDYHYFYVQCMDV